MARTAASTASAVEYGVRNLAGVDLDLCERGIGCRGDLCKQCVGCCGRAVLFPMITRGKILPVPPAATQSLKQRSGIGVAARLRLN